MLVTLMQCRDCLNAVSCLSFSASLTVVCVDAVGLFWSDVSKCIYIFGSQLITAAHWRLSISLICTQHSARRVVG